MSVNTTFQQEAGVSTWTRINHFISTDKSLLSIAAINSAFGEDYMYWTNPLPQDVLQQVINDSFCFGLYQTIEASSPDVPSKPNQIGFARLITDNTTFAYLTDVYVLPRYQGLGLGAWLLDCIDQHLEAKPYLRWTMLRTTRETSRDAYKKRMGMMLLENGSGEYGPFMLGKKGKGNMV